MSTAQAEIRAETPADAEVHRRATELGFISVDVPKQAAENVEDAFERRDGFPLRVSWWRVARNDRQ